MSAFLENTELHFEMTVKNDGHYPDSWNEPLNSKKMGIPKTNEEALKIAKETVKHWNDNLMPYDNRRVLLNVQRVETKVIDLIDQNPE